MAEDLPAGQILSQIIERLDLLDRVLATNTARLHDIEKRLGIAPEPQRLAELLAAANGENEAPAGGQVGQLHPPAATVKTQDLNSSESPQPTRPNIPINKHSGQTWPQAQLPEETWLRPESPDKDETRASHSWMNETSTPHSGTPHRSERHTPNLDAHSSRVADTPFTLNVPVEGPAPEREPFRAEPAPGQKRRDLESMVGGSWFNWIGIIAVTLGMGFFLKLAFDKQWIGPAGRVTIAALVGITLLYLGERLRRRGMKSYAYILSGGGILVLYLSVFASYNLYHLIGQPAAFVLMTAVTTTAVLLSVRLDALPVALLGLVGGFLTPQLLSTGVDNEVGLFTYVALLDAGVLAVAYFKRWRSLDFASFVGTTVMTLGWASTFFEPGKLWTTIFFLSIFFVLYSLLPIFHHVLRSRPTRWFDVALALANATFYFGVSYLMLKKAGLYHGTPASQALLCSIFFTGLFYTTWRWSPDDLLLRYSYVGAAATFLTMAVAIQLELHWVTMAWAVEALMLTWVGVRSGERAARHAGFAIFGAAVSHWFIMDLLAVNYRIDPSFIPLLNRRALSCAVLVGAMAGAARLYNRAAEVAEEERYTVLTFFAVAGNAIAVTLLSLDLNDYFSAGASESGADLPASIESSRQFSISVLWTFYAAMILAVGVLRRSMLLRCGGLMLLVLAIGKVLVVDSGFYSASWHLPLFNHTFMAYTLLVAALSFSAWLYGRASGIDEGEQRAMVPILILSANLLALTALSLEVIGYYNRSVASLALQGSGSEIFRQLQEGKVFTLALVWTIYATYVFMVGVGRSNREWRFGGLLILVIASALVFANLSYYNAPWHFFVLNRTIGVFAVFIAAIWLIVRTYARSAEEFEEESVVYPLAIVAANVLAIIALSTQAAGYYEAKIAQEVGSAGMATLTADATASLRNLELAKQLSLSVVWGLYASGLFIAGRMRDLRLLRVMALALLSVTTLKVFIWDLSSLDRAYRIVSFIMLGAILLVVSYFYQRRQEPVEET